MTTALILFATLVPAAGATDGIIQSAGGVTYVSGGVGAESIEQLNGLSRNFNLKLVFALNSGDYVSGVSVSVADARGKLLLNTVSDGPWLLARLPAGNYQIVATFAGTTVTRRAAIGTAPLSTIDMRWASD